jgi:hypothetical protein
MQEYCKYDKGRRRRLDQANAAKKQKQQGQWDTTKGWQNHPPKQLYREVNNVSTPLTKTRTEATVDTKEGTRMVGDQSPRSHLHHLKGAATGISVGSMGSMHTTTRISALWQSRRK